MTENKCSKKQQKQLQNKNMIMDATIELIKRDGIDSVTVRNVCKEADIATGTFYYYFKNKDELLTSFIMESTFDYFILECPSSHISKRICELYLILIHKYLSFGKKFMKSFYVSSNSALSAYMGESDGSFRAGTIMDRCEKELTTAKDLGIIKPSINVHTLSIDICTIVKGIIFEWCLTDSEFDIDLVTYRMIDNYLFRYLNV
ncbi:MAG: TetR/AcrR family transcriptional regulator [bacterium]|nr:TetR/AcrR family transcriptional regulator [bacterium]